MLLKGNDIMNKALELAKLVLNENDVPMSAKRIYEYAVQNHADIVNQTFSGATPIDTLSSNLYVDAKRQDSLFVKYKEGTSAVRFGLKNKSYGSLTPVESEITTNNFSNCNYKEIDLHRFLVSFMDDCYCKTINANKSENKTKDKNTWIHPDIVGVKFMKEFYEKTTINLMKINNENPFELYSFELKQSINLSNVNDEFLQAATNSSWANYGYLVAKDIDDEGDLKEKLTRLNRTFGIGVIKLNVKTYSKSKILYPAQNKEIDYEFIDNLIQLKNKDIDEFFNEVMAICSDVRTKVVSNVFDKPFDSDIEGEEFAKSKNMI